MKLIEGNKYESWYIRTWIYDGVSKGDYTCDTCRKPRKQLHWFHAENNPDDHLKLGTECVKEMKVICSFCKAEAEGALLKGLGALYCEKDYKIILKAKQILAKIL